MFSYSKCDEKPMVTMHIHNCLPNKLKPPGFDSLASASRNSCWATWLSYKPNLPEKDQEMLWNDNFGESCSLCNSKNWDFVDSGLPPWRRRKKKKKTSISTNYSNFTFTSTSRGVRGWSWGSCSPCVIFKWVSFWLFCGVLTSWTGTNFADVVLRLPHRAKCPKLYQGHSITSINSVRMTKPPFQWQSLIS